MSGGREPGAAAGRVEVNVEHASRCSELDLGANAFANLEPWGSEARDQLACVQSDQRAALAWFGRDRLGKRRLGVRTAGGKKQSSDGDEQTHRGLVAGAVRAGKLVWLGRGG